MSTTWKVTQMCHYCCCTSDASELEAPAFLQSPSDHAAALLSCHVISHWNAFPFQDAYDSDDAGGDDELNAADKDVKDASVKWKGTAWWQKFAEAGVARCSIYIVKLASSGRATPGGRNHIRARLHVQELPHDAAGFPLASLNLSTAVCRWRALYLLLNGATGLCLRPSPLGHPKVLLVSYC